MSQQLAQAHEIVPHIASASECLTVELNETFQKQDYKGGRFTKTLGSDLFSRHYGVVSSWH
jgi:hypothetical protein